MISNVNIAVFNINSLKIMGYLRTIFAITVVFAHTWPGGLVFVGGQNAVQLFYMISGFLISYVYVERKNYSNVHSFYISRYLRLFPIYITVALVSLFAFLVTKNKIFLDTYLSSPFDADLLLIFSNAFIFGQDWVMFSAVKDNSLILTKNFQDSDIVLYSGLLVPQAWTLGIELTFYLIAPFVLPRRKIIYILLICSVLVRAYLFMIDLWDKDPWTYRFFPAELAFFLLGSLAHQILLPCYYRWFRGCENFYSIIATYSLVLYSLIYSLLSVDESVKKIVLFFSFFWLLPLIFIFQNNNRFDQMVGNLSYPIYIGHMIVVLTASHLFKKIGFNNQYLISLFCVIVSICFAFVLDRLIAVPFEIIRHHFRRLGR